MRTSAHRSPYLPAKQTNIPSYFIFYIHGIVMVTTANCDTLTHKVECVLIKVPSQDCHGYCVCGILGHVL